MNPEKYHLEKIDSGVTRDIYEITGDNLPKNLSKFKNRRDVIVKFARKDRYYYTNKAEFNVWRKTRNKDLFCPVYKLLNRGQFLVMKRADTKNVTGKHVSEYIKKYNKKYVIDIKTDIKESNIGILNNKPVLIDYPLVNLNR